MLLASTVTFRRLDVRALFPRQGIAVILLLLRNTDDFPKTPCPKESHIRKIIAATRDIRDSILMRV